MNKYNIDINVKINEYVNVGPIIIKESLPAVNKKHTTKAKNVFGINIGPLGIKKSKPAVYENQQRKRKMIE